MSVHLGEHTPLLFGENTDEGLVAVEHIARDHGPDEMLLFERRNGGTAERREPFHPFLVAERGVLEGCPEAFEAAALDGGQPLDTLALFPSWRRLVRARTWLARTTGRKPSAPDAPYLAYNDPVQQHLMLTGRTLFGGMVFEDLRRLQIDIECTTTAGYDFCNAERPGDAIVAVALGLPEGGELVLSAADGGEAALLARFVEQVRRYDPDVIEGHNLFNFDLPYLAARARQHEVDLALGRDGRPPARRPSRMSVGERTVSYERFDVFGRHVVDTLHLVEAYDVTHRALDSFGLKDVAAHFGLVREGRTYIEGSEIARTWREEPDKVLAYVADDVRETRALGGLLARSAFTQAQILPFSYQNVCVRGTATRIDALMVREYLRRRRTLPRPDTARAFEGGYTDLFVTGVVRNVHHCDVRSLYPSLMLSRGIVPRSDELGVFAELLRVLRDYRVAAKQRARTADSETERRRYGALQTTFKILINSFYGYLGFSQARFNDFEAAARVTAEGRKLLTEMIAWLRRHGATPVEIDTDGVYFVPPEGMTREKREAFRRAFADALPEGIEIEFDGEYEAMFSYKMKNYALLDADGEMLIKGAALKSRGLERFQRSFLRDLIRLRLEGRDDRIPALYEEYAAALRERRWPVAEFAKMERLQDSPASYRAKRGKGKTPRRAVYELALASDREYRAGDQLAYYVTGHRKSVAVNENARLAAEWDPEQRDENVAYYLAKLDALYRKFADTNKQEELAL